jgi:hypothetical protein
VLLGPVDFASKGEGPGETVITVAAGTGEILTRLPDPIEGVFEHVVKAEFLDLKRDFHISDNIIAQALFLPSIV